MDPKEAVRKLVTGGVTNGLLNPEQVQQFYVQIFEQLEFTPLCRKETRRAQAGEVDKIAIGHRLLRAKTEGPSGDDGYRVNPTFGRVQYSCAQLKLPWEVSEDVYHQNIEGEALEDKIMGLMTTQLALDLEDLHFNADSTDVSGDADFLTLNEGWLKQMRNGSHVVTPAAINGGTLCKGHFFGMYKTMPAKYLRSPNVCWLMNAATEIAWVEAVSNRATGAGDLALLGTDVAAKPMGRKIVRVPSFPDGTIVLADPQNFIIVNTWDVRIRKAAEGMNAVMNDMRYYSIFLDDDPIIQELDACVIMESATIDFS